MPINTNLNTAPYFDDYDLENQYYRVLYKPGFAVQARELTQMQTMLQNQVEQFGDNIFKEGSIVKGCNFTRINGLQFVKVDDLSNNINVEAYISGRGTETINGIETEIDYVYVLTGGDTGLQAEIISAAQGFESRPPDLNTFFIRYLNQTTNNTTGQFNDGESLTITRYKYKVGELVPPEVNPIATDLLSITGLQASDGVLTPATGPAYGLQAAPGIIFQKGHFLFADAQTLVVTKYTDIPDAKNVGYRIRERLVNARQDGSLYDNANGSQNENAPGADRLKLIPELVSLDTPIAEADASFFSLVRYQNGNAVTLRDVSQYNVIGEEMARRTYEESGNYILRNFDLKTERKENLANTAITDLRVTVGSGTAYVKGFRVENKGEQSFILDDIASTDVLNNQPVSLNYGSWYPCTYSGRPVLGMSAKVNLRNSSNVDIGEAYVLNALPGKIFLSRIYMSSGTTTDVDNIEIPGFGQVDLTQGFFAKENSKSELVFDSGVMSSFETSDTTVAIRQQQLNVTLTGTQITIAATGNDNFAGSNSVSDVLVIDSSSTPLTVSSVTTQLNDSELVINVASAGTGVADVYYNINKNLTSSGPWGKQERTTFVKATANVPTKTRYTLGMPDCYEIVQILDSAGIDVTSSFRLVPNQKDTFYDWSYIEYISGRPVPTAGVMSIEFKCFQLNNSTGEYFFTINSYPQTLDSNEIPTFTASSGKRYNLRECFDFRPYANKEATISYTVPNAASAVVFDDPVGSNANETFSDYSPPLIPAYNGTCITDIEHYLSRVDLLIIDSYGATKLIKGEEERYAVPPRPEPDQLVIGEVTIPGVPALTMQEANTMGKRDYAVKAKQKGIKNYTMKDLHSLEKKIENMSYYISLNQLESDTANLNIKDENGNTRFKNGFIVDPMNDLGIADVKHPEFRSAIRHKAKILTPATTEFSMDLIYASGTNDQRFPSNALTKAVGLSKNSDIPIIEQPFATNTRNCVSNFYNYAGRGQITPPYDANYDTTTTPAQIVIDNSFPTQEIIDNIQEFQPLTDTEVTVSGVNPVTGGGVETTTTRSLELVGETVTTTEQYVGDFVTNMEFQPFMAGRNIAIFMVGLRPNTRHYFYFDKVNVDGSVAPGNIDAFSSDDVRRAGSLGDPVTTDAEGVLRAVFALPANTFFVGDRVLEIADVDVYGDIESSGTSGGFVTYHAYNFSVEKTSLSTTTTTRTPEFEIQETTSTRNLPSRPAPIIVPTIPIFRRGDPLAQTFFIKAGMGQGSDAVYVSKVDLYFKRKSATNGVTVMLREVSNGYPAPEILPFSEIHLRSSQVNVSDDASVVTTVIFEAPVRLDTEKEYCVVVMPDGNDPGYLIFTSKVGGDDLTPGATQGQAIVQDWGDGVLFTSTNNRAWKSYQDEDIKFKLYRNNFDQSTGSVVLTNNNHEFFTVDSFTGAFNRGETIYQLKNTSGSTSATVSITTGTNTITGTALDDTYAGGDFILVNDTGNGIIDIFEIVTVDTSTSMTVDHTAGHTFSNSTANPIVKGELIYYNPRDVFKMYLEGSNASATRQFDVSGQIVGLDSQSTANIVSIDNVELSYFMPFISRSNDSVTSTTITGEFTDPLNVNNTHVQSLRFNDRNEFNKTGCLVYSLSNDPGKGKKFEITVNMANSGNQTSTPLLDVEVSKILAGQYQISETEDEAGVYVSKVSELAEDFDAEDFEMYLTGYRPTGTDIKVYFRGQNVSDVSAFTTLDWVEMELFEGVGLFSNTGNLRDFREFRYRIPASAKTGAGGEYQYTSADGGTFDTFRRWSLKIVMTSDRRGSVPFVKDYRGIALT